MECAHCEQVGATFKYGFANLRTLDHRYCDQACGRAHHRGLLQFCIDDRIKMIQKREYCHSHTRNLQTLVDCGLGWMSKQDVKDFAKKFQDDKLRALCPPGALKLWLEHKQTLTTFKTIRHQLEFTKLEIKVDKLQILTLQAMATRNRKMYPLYKAKLLEEWTELLDLCENDKHVTQEAGAMKVFYTIFEFETAFF
jgi:hypothetical protein